MMDAYKKLFSRWMKNDSKEPVSEMKRDPKCIAIVNQKGGCAKTTTSVSLASMLARDNHKVLLLDMDPQGHASISLGIEPDHLTTTIHDVLTRGFEFEKVIQKTGVANLDIAAAHPKLSGADAELAHSLGREAILKIAIKKLLLNRDYDYLIFDCAPTLNLVTVNALVAARFVLIPTQPHYLSLQGMRELFQTIDTIKESLNPELEVLGIVVTLFDSRIKLNHQLLDEIREYFKELVFNAVIPVDSKLAEVPVHKKPIHELAPFSKGAYFYRELSREVAARVLVQKVKEIKTEEPVVQPVAVQG